MQHLDEGLIHAWIDGAADDAERTRIEDHVATCADCAAAVTEARGLVAASSRLLLALDDVPGSVLPEGSTAAPRTAAPPVRRSRWRFGNPMIGAALAASLLVVSVTLIRNSTQADRAAPPGAQLPLKEEPAPTSVITATPPPASSPAPPAPAPSQSVRGSTSEAKSSPTAAPAAAGASAATTARAADERIPPQRLSQQVDSLTLMARTSSANAAQAPTRPAVPPPATTAVPTAPTRVDTAAANLALALGAKRVDSAARSASSVNRDSSAAADSIRIAARALAAATPPAGGAAAAAGAGIGALARGGRGGGGAAGGGGAGGGRGGGGGGGGGRGGIVIPVAGFMGCYVSTSGAPLPPLPANVNSLADASMSRVPMRFSIRTDTAPDGTERRLVRSLDPLGAETGVLPSLEWRYAGSSVTVVRSDTVPQPLVFRIMRSGPAPDAATTAVVAGAPAIALQKIPCRS